MAVLALGLTVAAGAARAETVTITKPVATVGIGNVVADQTASEFRIQAGSPGTVTKVSGTAVRLTSGGAGVQTITITCGGSGNCKKNYTVSISPAGGSGRSSTITKFNVSNLQVVSANAGTASFSPASPAEGTPLTFTIVSSANNYQVRFDLGTNVRFNTNSAPGGGGATAWNYSISVTP